MGKSFKFLAVTAMVAAMLLAGCATASLPAPTAEEASAFESELGKVLASSGFSGSLGFADKSVRGDYQPGDKLGLYTVTRNSHVRIDVDLSDIFSGGASVAFDVEAYYKAGEEDRSIGYEAVVGRGDDGANSTTITRAMLNGKEFDPAAMQAMLAD